jgi:hypothetical protein
MAEAAGLIVGVIALAGTFKDCIDLFAYVSASRNIGRDYELLNTKLDVEKALLLQWADRLRLLARDHDARLNEPRIRDAISGVLSSIQLVLGDSQTLQERYGMRKESPEASSISSDTTAVNPSLLAVTERGRRTLGGPRMTRFLADFDILSIRTDKTRERFPVMDKVRWVIHDKDKFEAMILELSYFVSKLNQIVPDTSGLLVSMAMEDLHMLRVDTLRMVLEASSGREEVMANSTEHAIKENCTRRILGRFWYRIIDDRRVGIADPHTSTLRWVLDAPSERSDDEWDDLSSWLEHGSDIYWVSGKAGSGKSTLMKYLYQHEKTKSLLYRWAGFNSLTMADFFFYALGTQEQKSQEGLTRAVLYQLLKAEPSLISTLFPNMWKEAHISEDIDLQLPSPAETKRAFDMICNGLILSQKFCFFIDGLDEYSGNYMDGISIIKSLAANPHIKVVVSSRPIPSCVQSFSEKPKLRLQDLTREDIAGYVSDTVGAHPYMTRLALLDPDGTSEICNALVDKASGVFLWVVLAARSLIEGFAAYDDAPELRRRVDELPPELEDLFQHMLGNIQPRYQSQAAKTLRVCYHTQFSRDEGIATIGLAVGEDLGMDFRKVSPLEELSDAEKRAKCEMLEGRLRSRCCGLLEVSRPRAHYRNQPCFCNVNKYVTEHDDLIDSKVTFIHRTVFDFLGQPGVWDLACLRIRDPLFDPDYVLSCISLQLFELSSAHTFSGAGTGETYLKQTLIHASRAASSVPRSVTQLILRLEELLQKILLDNPFYLPFTDRLWRDSSDLLSFFEGNIPFGLLLSIELGMANVVHSLATRAGFPQALSHMLLLHAIRQPYLNSFEQLPFEPSAEMVRYLLSSGCDPNDQFLDRLEKRATSPWRCWLKWMEQCPPSIGAADVTIAFLQAGADVSANDAERGNVLMAIMKSLFVDGADDVRVPLKDQQKINEKGIEIICMIEGRRKLMIEPSACSP